MVFGGVTPGPLDKAGVAAFHEQFMAAFPSTQAELVELVETGDRLAARLLPHVRHEGPFMGVEPTGREAVLAITTLLRMRDGQCIERWSTADMLGLMMQLARSARREADVRPHRTATTRLAGTLGLKPPRGPPRRALRPSHRP